MTMPWETLFSLVNACALLGWIALVLLPRGEFVKSLIFYVGVGLLCAAYTLLLALLFTGTVDAGAQGQASDAGFGSISGVRALFGSDGGVVTGWTHYIALDLFAGLWIARDADAKGFSRLWQAPVLVLTFVAGPAGLLVWLVIRERAARRAFPRSTLKRPKL